MSQASGYARDGYAGDATPREAAPRNATESTGTSRPAGSARGAVPAGWEQEWTMLSGVAVNVPSVLPGMLHLFAPDTTKDLIENLLRKRATGSVGLTCGDVLGYLAPLMDVSYDEVGNMLYEMCLAKRIWTVPGWEGDAEYTVWEYRWGD